MHFNNYILNNELITVIFSSYCLSNQVFSPLFVLSEFEPRCLAPPKCSHLFILNMGLVRQAYDKYKIR